MTPGMANRVRWFVVYAVLLCLAFAKPLYLLARYSAASDLHSHALLVPLVAAYLVWERRHKPVPPISSSPVLAVIPAALGLAALNAYFVLSRRGALPEPCDGLAMTTAAWWGLLLAGALAILGGHMVRAFLFPAAFLLFMIPMPTAARDWLEIVLQRASAEAAAGLFAVTGATVFREGQVFQLPGLTIRVAQECSGIRSTWVLFIVSLVAAYWLLRSPWRRAVLVLAVVPLAILRNAFRIVSLALLTVHVDARVIDSPLHHKGGPIFFVLSLVPFLLLLGWLRHTERGCAPPQTGGPDRLTTGGVDADRRPGAAHKEQHR